LCTGDHIELSSATSLSALFVNRLRQSTVTQVMGTILPSIYLALYTLYRPNLPVCNPFSLGYISYSGKFSNGKYLQWSLHDTK